MTWMSQHNFFTAFTGPQPAEIAARVESLTQALRDEPARRQMMVFTINEAEGWTASTGTCERASRRSWRGAQSWTGSPDPLSKCVL